MAWLLDTNILSELRRPKPEPKVVAFVAAQPLEQLHISVVTLAEIRFGIELVSEPNRRAELNEWLTHKVRPMFDQQALAITEDIMLKWRVLVEEIVFSAGTEPWSCLGRRAASRCLHAAIRSTGVSLSPAISFSSNRVTKRNSLRLYSVL